MKRISRIFISCLATVLILIGMLSKLTNLTERKYSMEKNTAFFEEKENFDVLFFGSSRALNAVYPMELWNDYGIVSYNLAGHASRIPTTYWVMMNALDYTDPKLVVIDTYMWLDDYKMSSPFSYMHSLLDCFPLSIRKVQAVWDLFNDPVREAAIKDGIIENEQKSRLELLWSFGIYHSRWNELTREDFEPVYKLEKGAEARVGVRRVDVPELIPPDNVMEGDTNATEYLSRMIDECKRRGIQVLLTFYPSSPGEAIQMQENRVRKIAEQNNIRFIYFPEEEVVDYNSDFWDQDHMNPSGARKVTSYLGKIIRDEYKIPDHRGDSEYSHWAHDYENYIEYKKELFHSAELLSEYLVLCAGDDVEVVLDIHDPSGLVGNIRLIDLIENLHLEANSIDEDTDFILIGEKEAAEILKNFRDNGSRALTAEGEAGIYYNDSGEYGIYMDGREVYLGDGEADTDIEVEIRRNGNVIDRVTAVYDPETEDYVLHRLNEHEK